MDTNDDMHASGKTTLVHKEGEEGSIVIDSYTGHVIPGQQDKPVWSDGFLLANLAERTSFYNKRLGPELFTAEMQSPTAFAADDLGWVCWDQEQKEVEIEPSAEYRSEVLRTVFAGQGLITTDANGEDAYIEGSVFGVMMDPERRRTEEELSAIEANRDTYAGQELKRANG